ncbi:MAG: sulfotransferase [Deltaproteobacteria bacterium]|nr:sulfotransferase [Deltaproteobacteria bacterium]
MLEPVLHPLPSRIINGIGAGLRAGGLHPLSFAPGKFKKRATRMIGLRDFGEADFEEGLSVLCESVERDAGLLLTGRLAYRDLITNSLVTRLLRIEARQRRPAVFKLPLVPPLIVLGLPRSGTTLLHRLLSLSEDARSPALWEMQQPIPPPGADERREMSLREVKRFKKVAPDIDAKHHVDVDEPEEEIFLFDSSFWSFSFWVMAPVYGYLDWYLRRDPLPGYRVYREHLQLLQETSPGKRLTLKAPAHTGHIEALIETVPEAMIVQTHRDPVKITSSINSLMYTLQSYLTESLDVKRAAAANTGMFVQFVERNMASRRTIPEGRILDIRYRDLTADPVGTVKRIYDHFGLKFDESFESRMRKWMAERPQHKFGKHEYAAEDFGMTDAQISEQFKDYVERFL